MSVEKSIAEIQRLLTKYISDDIKITSCLAIQELNICARFKFDIGNKLTLLDFTNDFAKNTETNEIENKLEKLNLYQTIMDCEFQHIII